MIKWFIILLITMSIWSFNSQANAKYTTIRNPFAYGKSKPVVVNKTKLPISPKIQTKQIEKKQMQLRGIIQTSQGYSALINQTSVEIGDIVAGWTVVTITANSVQLKNGDTEKTLQL
jgi:hypothetical protein